MADVVRGLIFGDVDHDRSISAGAVAADPGSCEFWKSGRASPSSFRANRSILGSGREVRQTGGRGRKGPRGEVDGQTERHQRLEAGAAARGKQLPVAAMRPKEKKTGYSGSNQYIRREATPLPAQETWWRFNRDAAWVGGGNLVWTMDRAETRRSSWNVFYSSFASPSSGADPQETGVTTCS
jgi:hypothetical protein